MGRFDLDVIASIHLGSRDVAELLKMLGFEPIFSLPLRPQPQRLGEHVASVTVTAFADALADQLVLLVRNFDRLSFHNRNIATSDFLGKEIRAVSTANLKKPEAHHCVLVIGSLDYLGLGFRSFSPPTVLVLIAVPVSYPPARLPMERMTDNRIDRAFTKRKAAGGIALMPFIPAGYPNLQTTAAVLPAGTTVSRHPADAKQRRMLRLAP